MIHEYAVGEHESRCLFKLTEYRIGSTYALSFGEHLPHIFNLMSDFAFFHIFITLICAIVSVNGRLAVPLPRAESCCLRG